jgi:hypothetical protein
VATGGPPNDYLDDEPGKTEIPGSSRKNIVLMTIYVLLYEEVNYEPLLQV